MLRRRVDVLALFDGVPTHRLIGRPAPEAHVSGDTRLPAGLYVAVFGSPEDVGPGGDLLSPLLFAAPLRETAVSDLLERFAPFDVLQREPAGARA